jgi:hypothetical protein
MFSTIYAVLLRPLPFRDPDRLVWIENLGRGGLSARTMRADTFNAWREQNTSFDALAAYFAFFDFDAGRRSLAAVNPNGFGRLAYRTTSSRSSECGLRWAGTSPPPSAGSTAQTSRF